MRSRSQTSSAALILRDFIYVQNGDKYRHCDVPCCWEARAEELASAGDELLERVLKGDCLKRSSRKGLEENVIRESRHPPFISGQERGKEYSGQVSVSVLTWSCRTMCCLYFR